ncbi:MAG TPA: hypothetical protein VEB64_03425 [Azospirillaceae bacterium]|nr:hypothetical protein [Azospirillaceae bacterium]
MRSTYTYEETLAASEKINWQVEDLIGENHDLDFTKPFLPESLARVTPLDFLTLRERVVLNQIRGHGYLYMFGLVEEFILPFVLDHARPQLGGDDTRTRAFLGFAAEEAKHIHLFKRFRAAFTDNFGVECAVIGPPSAIAGAVLAHDPLAVALITLHIEWMTQRHYLDSIRDDQCLDPRFKSLLKHHWMEEAQHAKLDTLMVEALAEGRDAAAIMSATQEYLEIGGMFDAGLKTQTEFDLDSFERATGRRLSPTERETFMTTQHQANRWTFIGSGMTHPKFVQTLDHLSPEAGDMVSRVAPAFR